MASITIHNLDDDLIRRLRLRATIHGCSVEEEALDILRRAAAESTPPRNLVEAIRARLAPPNTVDLDLPVREAIRNQSPSLFNSS